MPAVPHRVPVAEAAARLPELIALAEAGEAVWIDREDAAPVQLLAKSPGGSPTEADAATSTHADRGAADASAAEVVEAMRRDLVGMFGDATLEEVLSWKHEGHRHG